MIQETEDKAVKIARDKLDLGYTLAVVGWRDSNHDQFTKSIPGDKVLFFERAPQIMPKSVGYILMTRFVSHGESGRVRKQAPTYPIPFSNGCIKRILKRLTPEIQEQELVKPAKETRIVTTPSPVPPAVKEKPLPNVVIDSSRETNFAHEFIEMVGGDYTRTLSKYEATKLVRKHFGEVASASRFPELLTPVIGEGNSKAGAYKATDKLLELAMSSDTEPTDPIEKAQWLSNRKPSLEKRQLQLQEELERIGTELIRVSKAVKLLDDLRAI